MLQAIRTSPGGAPAGLAGLRMGVHSAAAASLPPGYCFYYYYYYYHHYHYYHYYHYHYHYHYYYYFYYYYYK